MRTSIRIISFFLTLLMILSVIPMSVFAGMIENGEVVEIGESPGIDLTTAESEFISETEIEYKLEDGSSAIATYNTPVNYIDEDDEWQHIEYTADMPMPYAEIEDSSFSILTSTYVSQSSPDTTFTSPAITVGTAYTQFNYLPQLTSEDLIISAYVKYNLWGGNGADILVYEVTDDDFDVNSVTYNNQPTVSGNILDKATVENGSYKVDVTKVVKNWYKNNTTGAIKLVGSGNDMLGGMGASLVINYRKNAGINTALSYTTDGNVYVNNATGNVVAEVPAGDYLSLVYNQIGGWKTNVDQTLTFSTDSNNNPVYTYTDGTGCSRNIILDIDTSRFVFEDEKETDVRVSSSSLEIDGITYRFTNTKLTSIEVTTEDDETVVDTTTITYTDDKITAVVFSSSDSEEVTTVTLTYDEIGRLSAVDDTAITYTNNTVSAIGDVTVTYTSGGLLSSVGETEITYFEDAVLPYNTASLSEKTFEYNNGNKTNVKYSDEITVSYVFDSFGKDVTVFTMDEDGNILSTTSSHENKISISGKAGENLIPTNVGPRATVGTVSTDYTEYYLGNSSYLYINTNDSKAGFYKSAELTAGTYTYSAYLKSDTNVGIWVEDRNGNTLAEDFDIDKTVNEVDNGWERVFVSFTLDSTQRVKLYSGVNGAGEVYTDCMMVEKGDNLVPSAYNLFTELNTSSLGQAYFDTYVTNFDGTAESAVQLIGNGSVKTATCTLDISDIKTPLQLSAYVKGSSDNDGKFRIIAKVNFKYIDDSGILRNDYKETRLNFSKYTEEWQYASGLVSFPTNAVEITSIDIVADYSNNINSAVFDKISLTPCTALDLNTEDDTTADDDTEEYVDNTVYTYDENDNVTSTTLTVNGLTISTSSTYDAESNLLSYTNELGQTTSYTYNSENELTAITDAEHHTVYYTDTRITAGNTSITTTENGNTKTINANGTSYTIVYNDKEQIVSVSVGSTILVSYVYNTDGALVSKTYANGDVESYTYDIFGNITEEYLNGNLKARYVYDGNGSLAKTEDNVKTVKNIYSATGEYLATRTTADNYTLYNYTDEDGNNVDILNGTVLNNTVSTTTATDDFDRTVSETNGVVTETYSYITDDNGNTSYTVNEKTVSYGTSSVTYTYTYDNVGNIVSVSDGTYTTTYEYDVLYELTRENNQKANRTWFYTYDAKGNILCKDEYPYTVGALTNVDAIDIIYYDYRSGNWSDQLTSYDGQTIRYDANGKPLNWTNNRTLTWEGTTLSSIGNTNYTYDADGILQRVNNRAVVYDTNGNVANYGLSYKYDENGRPIGFGDNYFIYNEQGDVVKVYNTTLNSVVITYEYDAWGNVVDTTFRSAAYANMSLMNVYRYRAAYGYFYEETSGLYYLKTRFYDPQVGRFLSPDDTDYLGATGTTLSYNLYSYCENNPENAIDPSGNYSVNQIASGLADIFYGIAPFLDILGMALMFASFMVPWVGKIRLIAKILVTVYYVIAIINCLTIIASKAYSKLRKILAAVDCVYYFIKGVLTWIGGWRFFGNLMKNQSLIKIVVKAIDNILGSAYWLSRDMIDIINGCIKKA